MFPMIGIPLLFALVSAFITDAQNLTIIKHEGTGRYSRQIATLKMRGIDKSRLQIDQLNPMPFKIKKPARYSISHQVKAGKALTIQPIRTFALKFIQVNEFDKNPQSYRKLITQKIQVNRNQTALVSKPKKQSIDPIIANLAKGTSQQTIGRQKFRLIKEERIRQSQFNCKKINNEMKHTNQHLQHEKKIPQSQIYSENQLQKSQKDYYHTSHNRKLQSPSNLADNTTEYIKNGDFHLNTCQWDFCYWSSSNYQSDYVNYWWADPEMETGYEFFYKSGGGNNRVVELTGDRMTCIKQSVNNLPDGFYQFKYTFTARTAITLDKSTVFTYFNGIKIGQRVATSYDWNDVTISGIRIEGANSTGTSTVEVKLCGDPSVNHEGSIVKYVSLKRTQEIPIVVPDSNLPPNNTNTTINSTENSTATNTTNLTVANDQSIDHSTNFTSTQNITTANITFITVANDSSIDNQTNLASTENTTTANITYNTTNEEQNSFSYSFQLMLNLTVSNSIISQVSKIPAIRKLFKSGFSFFVNLDHLWLYMYHNRQYGRPVKKFLTEIRNLEEVKWNLLSQTFEKWSFRIDQIISQLDTKTHATPASYYEVEQNGREFLVNNLKFFIMNIPFVIAVFFLGKLLHKLFRKCRLSFFSEFALNSYLILILLEGNSESFAYFLMSDLLTLFARQTQMKVISLASVMFLFVLICLLLVAPFILRYLHQRKRKLEFYDKSKNSFRGALYFMVEFGLLNLLLGSVHVLAEKRPNLQLGLLTMIEVGFISFNLLNLSRRKKVFQQKYVIWVAVWASFLRVLIIFSSQLFKSEFSDLINKIEDVQEMLIILYLLLWIVSFLCSLIGQVIQTCKSGLKKIMKARQKRLKRKRTLQKQHLIGEVQNKNVNIKQIKPLQIGYHGIVGTYLAMKVQQSLRRKDGEIDMKKEKHAYAKQKKISNQLCFIRQIKKQKTKRLNFIVQIIK